MNTINKWDNGVYKSDAMAGVPGITAGCGTYTKDGSWTCTEHINWSGLELHVAGSSEQVCEVWYMNDEGQEVRLWSGIYGRTGGKRTWALAIEDMEKDERFFTPPTDEEIEAAKEALAKLLERMEA